MSFRNYDDWKAHNPADDEPDDDYMEEDHCPDCLESENSQCDWCAVREADMLYRQQEMLWRNQSEQYCPARPASHYTFKDEEDLPF